MEDYQYSVSYAFKCGLCKDRIFYNKQCIIKHIKHLHARVRYPCDICGKSFSSVDLLNIHYRAVHLGLKPYTCLYCNQAFSTNKALNNHIDIIHEHKSEYQCQFCCRHFEKKLPYHRFPARRKKVSRHKCRFCPKVFCTSRDKQVHLIRHRKLQNLAKCNICNKSFRNKVGLSRHTSLYHNVSCIFCEKIFKTQKQLFNHLRWHTNEKAYSCKVCGKEFRSCATRNGHMRAHEEKERKEKIQNGLCIIELGLNQLTLKDFYYDGNRKVHYCKVCYEEFPDYTAKKSHMKVHLPLNYYNPKFDPVKIDEEDEDSDDSGTSKANSCHF